MKLRHATGSVLSSYVRDVDHQTIDLVLEGGSIDTDGAGTLLIDGTLGGAVVIEDSGAAGTGFDVIIGSGAFTGTLQILNGGTLTSNNANADGEIYIGQGSGSNGILLLDNGTINANRAFYVADGAGNATGTVTIGDGIGVGDAILNTAGGNLEVGNDGAGTMTVLSDGIRICSDC